jgi:hypothetical protein
MTEESFLLKLFVAEAAVLIIAILMRDLASVLGAAP